MKILEENDVIKRNRIANFNINIHNIENIKIIIRNSIIED